MIKFKKWCDANFLTLIIQENYTVSFEDEFNNILMEN